MCQVDYSLYTLAWTPAEAEKLSVTVSQPHKCVNWNSLHKWMVSRKSGGRDMVRTF